MSITTEISNTQDIIDSREVIARLEELEDQLSGMLPGDEDREDIANEADALRALAEEGEAYVSDWQYGATLIHESYFTTYAQDLAEDIGYIQRDVAWPYSHIDWDAAADELKVDYSEIEFDGETYFVR